MKSLEGFAVTDRRGIEKGGPERDGTEFEERDGDGVMCVFKMIDGKKTMIKRGGHDAEMLIHEYVSCDVCGSTHLSIGGETIICPRLGFVWTPGWGPGYGPYGRDDHKRQLDPGGTTPLTGNLNQLARLVGYHGD